MLPQRLRRPAGWTSYCTELGGNTAKTNLVEYECEHGHRFFWFGAGLRRCAACSRNDRGKAKPIARMLPCQADAAKLPREDGLLLLKEENLLRTFDGKCIFEGTCEPKSDKFRILDPPKSISIKGQTSWTNSMADRERGGGGMMG